MSNMCLASILICVSVFKSSCGRHSSPDDVRQRGNLSFDSQMLHRPPPLADSALEALIPQRLKVSAGATVGASLSLADSLNLNRPSVWWFTRSCLNSSAVCAWRPQRLTHATLPPDGENTLVSHRIYFVELSLRT